MGVAKFDDGLPDNPKFIAAGPVPSWLWFCSVLYSRRALTDGFIPKQKVPTLVVGLGQAAYKHAAKLVAVGLWKEAVGGYEVNGFLEWNPSKSQVEAYRAGDKQRKQAARSVRDVSSVDTLRRGLEDTDSRGATRARTHAGAKSVSESEPEVLDLDLPGESAREGEEFSGPSPVWTHRGRARTGLVVTHLRCLPLAAAACERGICVPAFLVQREWLPQVEHHELDITKFIQTTLASQPDGPIGDDPLTFWRARWRDRHGTTLVPRTRTGDSLDAGKRSLERRLAKIAAEEGGVHVQQIAGTRES